MPVHRRTPRLTVGAGLAGGGIGAFAGPMAAALCAAYVAAGTYALLRISEGRARRLARKEAVDTVGLLAADLRAGAGLPNLSTMESSVPALTERLTAAVTLAGSTGAPLADLLDRLDVDIRSAEQAAEGVHAQAAGARATAAILAALPFLGVVIGYGIGVDPLTILLYTPVGVSCVLGSTLLQAAGLAWSVRLSRVEVPR